MSMLKQPIATGESTFRLNPSVKPSHYSVHWTVKPSEKILLGSLAIDVEYQSGAGTNIHESTLVEEHAEIFDAVPKTESQESLDDSTKSAQPRPTTTTRPSFTEGFFIHACGLTLADQPRLTVAGEDSREIPLKAIFNYPKHEAWLVTFDQIPSGVSLLRLHLSYSAPISGLSAIRNGNNRSGVTFCSSVDKEAVVTHLEPTHARKLVPCFDEPCFRATYQVTMTVPKHLSVFTGTLPESETCSIEDENQSSDQVGDTTEQDAGDNPPCVEADEEPESPPAAPAPAAADTSATKTILFEKTSITLPSYLISFVVGDFRHLESETKRGVKVRVIFGRDKTEGEAYFSLNLLAQAVEFYEEYFQFPLPLKKLDMVAIDELPVMGMENWGLITMLSDYLMVDDKTTVERKRRIARLIGHEVAHHWFGDLVTLEWWRYIWLKEGMARYLEFVFVNHVHPKWHIWLDFLHTVQNETLKADCTQGEKKGHPVETEPPSDPRKVFDLFDIISYGKAASIIRMVATGLGPTAFAAALREFFKANALKSVSSERLYECWAAKFSEKPTPGLSDLGERISAWVTSIGHPYVYAEKVDGGMRVYQFKCASHLEGLMSALQSTVIVSPRPESARYDSASVLAMPGWVTGPGSNSSSPGMQGRPRSRSGNFRGPMPVSTHIDLKEHLGTSRMWIPFSVTEVEMGVTSAVSRFDLPCTESHTFPCGHTAWFHTQGNGTLRCDYDTASWDRILSVYPYFGGQDRLTIATTVFELRMYHVGLCANDKSDRCLLLLKFISQLVEKKESHNFLWTYMAPKLIELITLTRHTAVWRSFQPFLQKTQRYLVDSGSVSFFGSKEADLNTPADILPSTLASLLRVNCLIGQPSVVEEAYIYFEWVLSGISEEFSPPEGKERPTDFSKILVSRTEVAFECVAMHGTLSQWVTMCRLFNLLYPKQLVPPALPPPVPSPEAVVASPTTPASEVEADTNSSMLGALALEVDHNEALTLMQDITKPLVLLPDLTRKEVGRLTTSVLCGIVGREGKEELPIQLTTVSLFRMLGSASASVRSNSKLFSALLEPTTVPPPPKVLVKYLISSSAGQCSNAIIAQQFASLSGAAFRNLEELERGSEKEESGAGGEGSSEEEQHVPSSTERAAAIKALKEECDELDSAFRSVINQCKWVEYATDHWNWYLLDLLGEGVVTPEANATGTGHGSGTRHNRTTSSASDGSLAT